MITDRIRFEDWRTVQLPGACATANVNLRNGQRFRGVPHKVVITAGGPGTAGMKLTVIGAFDKMPEDTVVGNGNYDFPQDTVAPGAITIATS